MPAFRTELAAFAFVLLGIVGAFLVRMYAFPEFLFPKILKYDPEPGAFVVVAGGLVCLAVLLRLSIVDPPGRDAPRWLTTLPGWTDARRSCS